MMSVFSRAGAGIQNILSEWRQPASRSSLCVGSFLFGRESGHSIARPIACGNRVPPQRTVLGETTSPPISSMKAKSRGCRLDGSGFAITLSFRSPDG